MAISDDDRDHLFDTLRRQYDEDDARTLITLLGYSAHPDELATKVDLLALARQADLDDLRRDVASIWTVVDDADLNGLEADVAALKSDVAVLKADVAVLKSDVAVLKTDVAELKSDVAVLKTDVAELKTSMGELRVEVAQQGSAMRDVLIEQSRHHQRAMVALLSVYTAMAGTLVAIGAIIIS